MNKTDTTIRTPPQDTKSPEARVLTPKEFHTAIGGVVGINRIYDLLRAKRLRHVRIGSRYLVLKSEVDGFFARESETRLA